MQVQVEIGFDQLLGLVKNLPASKLKMLRAEIEKDIANGNEKNTGLEQLLLNGPVATKKQLATIANNRKAINRWRAE